MTRDEIRNDILKLNAKSILAELPTSAGKSRVAIEFINEKGLKGNILIVVPRLILFDNWKDEFVKWGYEDILKQVTFTTYISLAKHCDTHYDLVIFDECHHLSERAREAVDYIDSEYNILLSATVKKPLKKEIKLLFPGIKCYKVSLKEAIDENILPDPKVYLVPLQLDNKEVNQFFLTGPKKIKNPIEVPFSSRFQAKRDKTHAYKVMCTQAQYYEEMSSMVDFYKRQYFRTNNQIIYFRWQKAAKDRLMWLSGLKNDVTKKILSTLKDKRTLTFCNSIEQTEILGKYCINSKNDNSAEYLDKFNKKKINHITSCSMLNEGCNLIECQVGIFVSINSSETMVIQRVGRILRHSEPIIFIIYYKDTREEELVQDMLVNYNPELITVVENLEQLNNGK